MMTEIKSMSLKAARVDRGYTQEDIAEKLGVSRLTYIGWERGEVIPRDMVVYALAYIYNMDSDLLRLTPQKNFT